jgi:hypothetical protein
MGQQRESSKSRRREDAVRLLKTRLGEIVAGNFVRPERLTMRELFQLVVDDYTARDHRSLYYVKLRIDTHLAPAVGKIRATEFGNQDVKGYLRRRRNGEHRLANANGFSRRPASVLRVSAKHGHQPAHGPACLSCCFTTYVVQRCATWNVPAYLVRPPWPSLATKQRPSTGAMR